MRRVPVGLSLGVLKKKNEIARVFDGNTINIDGIRRGKSCCWIQTFVLLSKGQAKRTADGPQTSNYVQLPDAIG